MAKAASDPELRAGFEKHAAETEGHVERLERVFEIIGKPARAKTCDAILGILEEGKDVMSEYKGTIALDAGLISSGQAAEHYEMARYGTLRTWAQQLGFNDARQAARADAQRGKGGRQGADRLRREYRQRQGRLIELAASPAPGAKTNCRAGC